jgi:hypothetical protein
VLGLQHSFVAAANGRYWHTRDLAHVCAPDAIKLDNGHREGPSLKNLTVAIFDEMGGSSEIPKCGEM